MTKSRRKRTGHDDPVDAVLGALRKARDTWALLPALPEGVRPSHIRILGAMDRLGRGGRLRVSDINAALDAALPNTTRFIGELVEMDALRKIRDDDDGRVVLIETTPFGEELAERYVRKTHDRMARAFSRIGADRCLALIETIDEIHAAMEDICGEPIGDKK